MSSVNQHQLSESNLGKDANVLIMELNKGLQSPNLGEQCKAIAQFPNLLEKYPFPMVVNSIFLKITQIFCDGSNYLRLCVLRACSECRVHLEKLTICDDIVRKLMPFTSSNDPAARALTLRLFGTLSRITSEHIGVHHAILKQIDSHYEVESDAAIWSSHQLAPISSEFAVSLCPILCKLLNEVSSDWDIKLKLLRLGKHMHHEVQIVEQMRSCLVNMLAIYSNAEFVLNILNTLTSLTTRAPIHTTQQIDLLLGYLADDTRPWVRQCVLRNLCTLAKHVPHQWEISHIQKLCELYNSQNRSSSESEDIIHVFYCLADSNEAVDVLKTCSKDPSSGLVACIQSALITVPTSRLTIKVIQLACKLLWLFVAHTEQSMGGTDAAVVQDDGVSGCGLRVDEFVSLVVTHFLVPVDGSSGQPLPWYLSSDDLSEDDLKLTYSSLVQLFSCFPDYVSCIHEMNLWNLISLDGGPRVGLLCQFLSTLVTHLPQLTNSVSGQDNPMRAHVLLERLSGQSNKLPQRRTAARNDSSSVLSICGLIFQLSNDRFLTSEERRSLLLAIAAQSSEQAEAAPAPVPARSQLPTWLAYQVARQASRYGQHVLAANIYQQLIQHTFSERSNYWIQGLTEFSKTEATVISVARRLHGTVKSDNTTVVTSNQRPPSIPWILELIDALHHACDGALQSRTTLICVGGPDPRWFQAEYVGLRGDLFSCLAELCASAYHHSRVNRWPNRTTEPAAAESEQPASTPFWLFDQRDLWDALAERVSTCQAQCLDADESTHNHLNAIGCLVAFFIQTINTIIAKFDNSSTVTSEWTGTTTSALQSSNSDPFSAILPTLESLTKAHLNFQPVAFVNFDWIPSLVLTLMRTAPHWPRFFFQRLQTTTVRLVLLPKAGNNPEDVLTISNEVGHMIQVMGVVQQHSRRELDTISRRIAMVEVELTVTELPAAHSRVPLTQLAAAADRQSASIVYYSKRSGPLQRDYFHCEFCVQFPGHQQLRTKNGNVATDRLYAVRAVPVLVDHLGARWRLTRVSGAPEEVTFVRVECAKTNSTPSSVSVPTESSSDAQPSTTRTTASSAKVDMNRVALDAQFSLTKPRPIGRPVVEPQSGSRPTRTGPSTSTQVASSVN